jgi:hypothetical protein
LLLTAILKEVAGIALLSIAAYALLLDQVYEAPVRNFGALAHKNLALHQMCCDRTTGTETLSAQSNSVWDGKRPAEGVGRGLYRKPIGYAGGLSAGPQPAPCL